MRSPDSPEIEIVIPVRNEDHDLAPSVRRLHAYLGDQFPVSTRITIADNGSTDGTWVQARALQAQLPAVRAVRLERPGRGNALRTIWSASGADVYAYMDVDLSTDLNALFPLLAPLLSGHSDVAIGTGLARGARVVRGPRREFISRSYNLLLHASLGTGFSDAQCGFKAIRAVVARQLLPLTTDDAWFFDTELLVLAERAGLRIHEVPVDWIDDPDSRVDVARTALADLRGIVRLGAALARGTITVPVLGSPCPPGLGERGRPGLSGPSEMAGQLVRFVLVGVASTLAFVLLYLLLRPVMNAQPANAVSLLVTAIANTAVNRRFTFGIRPGPGRSPPATRPDRVRHRAGAHFGGAHRPARGQPAPGPGGRSGRPGRGQPGRHRHEVRPLPDVGVPGAHRGARARRAAVPAPGRRGRPAGPDGGSRPAGRSYRR